MTNADIMGAVAAAAGMGLLFIMIFFRPVLAIAVCAIYCRALWLLLQKAFVAAIWEIYTQRGACLAKARKEVQQ